VIPSLAKFKTLTDFYCKFARFWLIILIVLDMSSSYTIEANASTGGAGIFYLPGSSVSCDWQDRTEVRILRAQKVWLLGKERDTHRVLEMDQIEPRAISWHDFQCFQFLLSK
jgi:hypothetical protein